MEHKAYDTIARILRCDKDDIIALEKHLEHRTGKRGVLSKIMFLNEEKIDERLKKFGLSRNARAKDVFDSLIRTVEDHDADLKKAINGDNSGTDFISIVEKVKEVADIPKGYFIKKEKLTQFLYNEPPRKVMEFLGYDNPIDLVQKEDLFEIMSALRFIEGSEWLNERFFRQYEVLTPDDFEERPVEIRVLSEKWGTYARNFVEKKWHNVSHLKEFGSIFVIPISLGISGETLRTFSLVFHYTHEIPFYSEIVKELTKEPKTFAHNLLSLLRGDVFDQKLVVDEKMRFLVVQRYLAKDDENDWRLFVPRINPEALHWLRAEEDLSKLGVALGYSGKELHFWKDFDWVGNYFRDDVGSEVLVSFDLVDTVMSLIKQKEMIKYLYHQQEALWNKIFIEYFSVDELEKYARRNLLRGYFEI
ncbi:hypothetical protein C4565_05930 [Candidatus Parcubacteria bacterium]|jgi:hypothetical protein|nr:MAG: hypothetical protein C4565_05930 [Candidatus Parcubacteria bacterium]